VSEGNVRQQSYLPSWLL